MMSQNQIALDQKLLVSADPTIISLALLPMPLVLQSSTCCFFGRNRWVALSQGFNVMLLWDKGGFKYGICKQRSNQGGIKRMNLIFDCSILVIFIQYSNLIWSTFTTLHHWHEQMMSANLTGNAQPKRSHTCWNRASHFGEKNKLQTDARKIM